jgi:hypothetical protein
MGKKIELFKTEELEKLFEMCYEKYFEQSMSARDISEIILLAEENGYKMFEEYTFEDDISIKDFCIKLGRYKNRIYSGIKLKYCSGGRLLVDFVDATKFWFLKNGVNNG